MASETRNFCLISHSLLLALSMAGTSEFQKTQFSLVPRLASVVTDTLWSASNWT